MFTGDLQIQSMMTKIPFFSKTTFHIIFISSVAQAQMKGADGTKLFRQWQELYIQLT